MILLTVWVLPIHNILFYRWNSMAHIVFRMAFLIFRWCKMFTCPDWTSVIMWCSKTWALILQPFLVHSMDSHHRELNITSNANIRKRRYQIKLMLFCLVTTLINSCLSSTQRRNKRSRSLQIHLPGWQLNGIRMDSILMAMRTQLRNAIDVKVNGTTFKH